MLAKKTLELNPHHPIMKRLLETLKESDGTLDSAQLEYVDLLFQIALLNSGFSSDEPSELTVPLEKLIRVGFGVERDAPIVEIEIELDEPETQEEEVQGEEEPEEIPAFQFIDDEL